ncbi:MAG: hybrid sensor histidine kinase/response regulator, partial [Alphaproteobacteria bacterium]
MSGTDRAMPAARRSAYRVLRLAVWAIAVVPASFFCLHAWWSHEAHFRAAKVSLERTLDLVHEHAVKVMETQALVVTQVERMLEGPDDGAIRADEERLHRRLSALEEALPQVRGVWVLGADGHPLLASSLWPAPHELDLSDREYFRVHRDDAGRGSFVSPVLLGRALDIAFFQVSTRRAGEAFAGVVGVSMLPRYFEEYYARVVADGAFSVVLARPEGEILARHPATGRPLHEMPPMGNFRARVAASPTAGSYTTVSALDGVERMIVFRRIPQYPIYVMIGLPIPRIRRDWATDLATTLAVGLPATLALLAMALFALR